MERLTKELVEPTKKEGPKKKNVLRILKSLDYDIIRGSNEELCKLLVC